MKKLILILIIGLVINVSMIMGQNKIKKTVSVGRIATISYYCLKGRMANGKHTSIGYVAADTRFYKMGSKIKLNGTTYTIGDTGSAIRGPLRFDIYVNSCSQARTLGKKKMFLEL